jgi:hypothetical protein
MPHIPHHLPFMVSALFQPSMIPTDGGCGGDYRPMITRCQENTRECQEQIELSGFVTNELSAFSVL